MSTSLRVDLSTASVVEREPRVGSELDHLMFRPRPQGRVEDAAVEPRRGSMERQLLVIESSEPGLPDAASGLAALLDGRATVFAPLPAVAPQARMAVPTPSVVVLGVNDATAGAAIGAWIGRYVEQVPGATVVCAVGRRSTRVDSASRESARDEVAALLTP